MWGTYTGVVKVAEDDIHSVTTFLESLSTWILKGRRYTSRCMRRVIEGNRINNTARTPETRTLTSLTSTSTVTKQGHATEFEHILEGVLPWHDQFVCRHHGRV